MQLTKDLFVILVFTTIFFIVIWANYPTPEPTLTPAPSTAPAPAPKRRYQIPLPEEPPFLPMPRRAMEPDLPKAHDPRHVSPEDIYKDE